jgi:phage terminase large subunit-like protein
VEGPKRGLVWDVAAAERAINFFPDVLRLNGGQFEGKPFVLHPSQAFKTGSIFGWKRADGTRRFRRAYIEEGKGNGKSPWAAGTGMYCLLADGEARAEVYAAGKDKNQAMVLFRDAVAMMDQSPALSRRLTPSGGNPVWNLADIKTGSFFRPISKEQAHSGPRPYVALCDEIHEHPNGAVIEMLERGFKFRRQPLLIMITNSGSNRNSVCWEEHQHAVRVAAGTRSPDDDSTFVGDIIDDSTFSFVCALDRGDNPLEDPTCWPKANPLLGTILEESYLAGVVAQAKALPGKLNGILRLHFCCWTDSDTAWLSQETLDAVMADFDPAELTGEDTFVGIDLSGSQDLTAMAFVVPTGFREVHRADGVTARLPTFDAWVEAWTPRDTMMQRALEDQVPYDVWERDGWLNAPPGKYIRMDFVAARLAEVAADHPVKLVAYDRYAYKKFADELDQMGVTLPQIEHPQGGKRRAAPQPEAVESARRRGEEPPQGLWMPGSLNELEQMILDRRIRMRRSPVLYSACAAAALEHDAFDNRWFSKSKATARIDPVVALAMAVGAATSSATAAREPEYQMLFV